MTVFIIGTDAFLQGTTMQTQQFTYRDPQVEGAIFPADEAGQMAAEAHFNGQINGTRLHPSQRVLEMRDIDGHEVQAKVGDWVTKSISGGVRVFDPITLECVFEPANIDAYIATAPHRL